MFDDHACGCVETAYAVPGRIGIGDVVIGEFLALQLLKVRKQPGWAIRINVKRRALLGVFAVAQDLFLVDLQRQDIGPGVACWRGLLSGFGDIEAAQVVCDRTVVGAGMGIHLGRELQAQTVGGPAGLIHFSQYCGIVRGIDDNGHATLFSAMVFGGSAQHGRSADIDVFDSIFKRTIEIRNGLAKRI